jgi:hypothetical protein
MRGNKEISYRSVVDLSVAERMKEAHEFTMWLVRQSKREFKPPWEGFGEFIVGVFFDPPSDVLFLFSFGVRHMSLILPKTTG